MSETWSSVTLTLCKTLSSAALAMCETWSWDVTQAMCDTWSSMRLVMCVTWSSAETLALCATWSSGMALAMVHGWNMIIRYNTGHFCMTPAMCGNDNWSSGCSCQCTRKTFMIHQTFVRWALCILFKFVKSLMGHLGLAIGNVRHVRWFSWTLSCHHQLITCDKRYGTK